MYGLAEKLYSAEQVRCLDACAINQQGVPGYELMNRAGMAVFRLAAERFADARHWVLVCGAGNNGGDGYIVARLARKAGIKVTLLALKEPQALRGDAHTAAADWIEAGGSVSAWPPSENASAPGLVIDALLGTGLDREVEGKYREAIEWMNAQDCPRLAVDIPSGLNADTGCVMGEAASVDVTVSFIGLKQGLLTCDGPDCTGELVFDSLEIPAATYDAVQDSGLIIRETILRQWLRPRVRNTHKGHYGHVLVAGGMRGMPGAVRLAGEAALRSGAGLVTIATHQAHAANLSLSRPELMVSATRAPEDMLPLLRQSSVLACGPGLGMTGWSRRLFDTCMGSGQPLVLDADGLNLLADNPQQREAWVLTPHPAEAGRLLKCDTAKIQSDRIESARALSRQYGATVVLKGCGTVVARSDGQFTICPLGNPGMATAGSGDVLTGVIAAMLGQGFDAWQAACLGVVVHAAAGDLAAELLGERGMLASDIIDAIPQVLG
jgi:NAD(P)H-hydrate epimerase